MYPQKIKAVIVDDEERARLLNQNLISTYCGDQIEIVGVYESVERAYEGILNTKPNLVFLDIDMPPYTGFDLLRKLQPVFFEVIFITAFDYYAIDAIRFSALDYLLKPLKIDELKNAVDRVSSRLAQTNDQSHQPIDQLKEVTKLVIHSQRGTEVIDIKEIIYFKAQNTYTEFFTTKENVLSTKPFVDYEDMFEDKNFFRNHRSYMVNVEYIKTIDNSEGSQIILKDHTTLPLAFRRKSELLKILGL